MVRLMAKTRISATIDSDLLEEFDQHVGGSRSEALEAAIRVFLRSVRDIQVAAYYGSQLPDEQAAEDALAATSVAVLAKS